MNTTKVELSVALYYMALMTIPGVYWMITTGGILTVIAVVHILISLAILAWHFWAVLIRM
jgi:hypothetical protein